MNRELVEARLRAALDGGGEPRLEGVDMSARAIEARLRDACEMATLCLELAKAHPT